MKKIIPLSSKGKKLEIKTKKLLKILDKQKQEVKENKYFNDGFLIF